jgi:hypothetical protein
MGSSTPGSPGSTTAGPNHTQKKSLIPAQKEQFNKDKTQINRPVRMFINSKSQPLNNHFSTQTT